ncbi:MAG: hypothetical protein ACK5KO_11855 [Arachnia sp.]
MTSTQWARLCELLADDDELAPGVTLAAADPEEFFGRHEATLRQRGIGAADAVNPWLVLIDGVDDAGALAYLDGKDGGEELAWALGELPRVVAAGIPLSAVAKAAGDIEHVAIVADRILGLHGLRLVLVDEGSDAYPFVVVAAAQADEVVGLAAALGHTVRRFS